MPPSARLLRLLGALQRRHHWAGTELSEYLEVTERTLRRDVDRLRTLGYTVNASSGPGGGYHLGPGARIPPLLLDDQEAIAMTVALRSAADSFAGLSQQALKVLLKLEPLLPARLRRRVTALEAVTVSVGRTSTLDAEVLTTLAMAARDHAVAQFGYTRKDGVANRRTVEPLHLVHAGDRFWYLIGWDTERADFRTFRVDRVQPPVELGARFKPRRLPQAVHQYVEEAVFRPSRRFQARALLNRPHTEVQVPPWCGRLESADAGQCWLHTQGDTLEAIAGQLLPVLADIVRVEPEAIALELRALAERLGAACGGVIGVPKIYE
jgi:predicted DNA-binding transcriptional regulator YafY